MKNIFELSFNEHISKETLNEWVNQCKLGALKLKRNHSKTKQEKHLLKQKNNNKQIKEEKVVKRSSSRQYLTYQKRCSLGIKLIFNYAA